MMTWISVKDELPKAWETVWIYFKFKSYDIWHYMYTSGHITPPGDWAIWTHGSENEEVIAWAPIVPYKDGDKS